MEVEMENNHEELTKLKKEIDALRAEMTLYIQGISGAAEIHRSC